MSPFLKNTLSLKCIRACRTVTPVVGIMMLAACQTATSPQPDERAAQWNAISEQSPRLALPMPSQDRIQIDLDYGQNDEDTDAGVELERPSLPNSPVKEIVMRRDIDLAVFLRMLAESGGVNMILAESVSGPIRVNLYAETTWDSLFLSLIEAHGLTYDWSNDILRVMAREDIDRQIAMEDVLRARTEAAQKRVNTEPPVLDVYRVRYANSERMASTIQSVLANLNADPTVDETGTGSNRTRTRYFRSTVYADPDSGLLIIHATPNNVERIRKLAEALDQPTHQILIEAHIVQTNKETARDLGVQWGAFRQSGRTQIGTSAHTNGIGDQGFNSNFPAPDFAANAAGFAGGAAREGARSVLQTQLTALQRDGQLQIVSSPSITTLDKQTAIIESGEERPFQSVSGTGANATVSVEFKQALLRLEVTPQVIDGDWIKMRIITSKDEFDDSKAVVIADTIQVPISTRSAETTLYLADGQTTVIGGLSTETKSDNTSGVPLLKDIPGIGAAFRSRGTRDSMTDTLIFITPHVLPYSGPVARAEIQNIQPESILTASE